jgi:hypothetical protein
VETSAGKRPTLLAKGRFFWPKKLKWGPIWGAVETIIASKVPSKEQLFEPPIAKRLKVSVGGS